MDRQDSHEDALFGFPSRSSRPTSFDRQFMSPSDVSDLQSFTSSYSGCPESLTACSRYDCPIQVPCASPKACSDKECTPPCTDECPPGDTFPCDDHHALNLDICNDPECEQPPCEDPHEHAWADNYHGFFGPQNDFHFDCCDQSHHPQGSGSHASFSCPDCIDPRQTLCKQHPSSYGCSSLHNHHGPHEYHETCPSHEPYPSYTCYDHDHSLTSARPGHSNHDPRHCHVLETQPKPFPYPCSSHQSGTLPVPHLRHHPPQTLTPLYDHHHDPYCNSIKGHEHHNPWQTPGFRKHSGSCIPGQRFLNQPYYANTPIRAMQTATPASTRFEDEHEDDHENDINGLKQCRWHIGHGQTCDKQFWGAESLNLHVEKEHIHKCVKDAETQKYYCHWQDCKGKSHFDSRPKLSRHALTHTGWRPFLCPECGKRSATKDQLDKHLRIHSGETPYSCPEPGCDKRFKTKTEATTHAMTHSKEKPHKCPHCSMAFSDSSNLSKHKAKHFLGRFPCDVCGYRAKRWDQLRRHFENTGHAPDLVQRKNMSMTEGPDVKKERQKRVQRFKSRLEREWNAMSVEDKKLPGDEKTSSSSSHPSLSSSPVPMMTS